MGTISNTKTKQISDYLHLYLGCQVMEIGGNTGTLKGLMEQDEKVRCLIDASSGMDYWASINHIQPILRPLNDMDEHDKVFYGSRRNFNSLEFKYLLEQQYDLFGLIELGLAIDKTTLEQPLKQ